MTRDAAQATETTAGQLQEASQAPAAMAPHSAGARGDIIINVRFFPNGLVNTITYQPEHMSAQAWFDHLCRMAPDSYRPLSGGRGSFAIASDAFATIG
jgi:hypothetical protein